MRQDRLQVPMLSYSLGAPAYSRSNGLRKSASKPQSLFDRINVRYNQSLDLAPTKADTQLQTVDVQGPYEDGQEEELKSFLEARTSGNNSTVSILGRNKNVSLLLSGKSSLKS